MIKLGMKCPNCNKYLDVKDDGTYYKCEWCEWECWPPEKDDTPEKLAKAARKAMEEDIRVGYVKDNGKKSSSSKSGRARKKVTKSLFTERYKIEQNKRLGY